MTRCCWQKFIPKNRWSKKTINLELTLVSADRLPVFRGWRSERPMKVYAEVSLDGRDDVKKSNVDVEGGMNPTWNFTVEYPITESTLKSTGVNLIVSLFCKGSVGRSLIGKVKICLKSLFEMGLRSENELGYRVEGTLDGNLSISYCFRVPNPLCG